MRLLYFLGLFLCYFFIYHTVGANTLPLPGQPPPTEPPAVVSRIDFTDTKHPKFKFSDASEADPFEGMCPVTKLPESLGKAVSQLVEKVRDSVSRIKATRSAHCAALENQLQDNQNQIKTAMTNQFIAANPGATTSDQDSINLATQRAGAINQMVLTVTSMTDRECFSSTDDLIAIQRLIGQIATFAGLIIGGWNGLGGAVGGQLIAAAPIFRDKLDKALKFFQKYDEMNERAEFLCLFRQMQKMECMMFANPKADLVSGIDLTFKTGPTRVTQESIEKIEKDSPQVLRDIQTFWDIHQNAGPFIAYMETQTAFSEGSFEAFHEFENWCKQTKGTLAPLVQPQSYPDPVRNAVASLKAACDRLNALTWPAVNASALTTYLIQILWDFRTVRGYYESIRNEPTSVLGRIAATWESLKHYQNYAISMETARNPSQGSLDRMQFRQLVFNLRRSLAKDTFKDLMQINLKALRSHGFLWLDAPGPPPVQREAIKAMVSLCQTLDPTLACVYVNPPAEESLHKKWAHYCVGPKSHLCRLLVNRDLEQLKKNIDSPAHWGYLKSVCGFKEAAPVPGSI